MSRHQLQPTCAATAMCANDLRLSSAASHSFTLPPNSRLAFVTLGLCQVTSIGSGAAPNCLVMLPWSALGSSAFGTRRTIGVHLRHLPVRHEDTRDRGYNNPQPGLAAAIHGDHGPGSLPKAEPAA